MIYTEEMLVVNDVCHSTKYVYITLPFLSLQQNKNRKMIVQHIKEKCRPWPVRTEAAKADVFKELKTLFYHHWLLRYQLKCAAARRTFQYVYQPDINQHGKGQTV